MFQKIILFITLLCTSHLVFAQEKLVLKPSGEITEKAENLYNDEEYTEAIALLQSIHENDTNYEYSLSELAYVYFLDSQYTKAIEVCDEGLDIHDEYETRFHNLKGLSYKSMEDYDQAVQVFENAIDQFPRNHLFYFNLANTYLLMDEYQKSYDHYKICARINPFYQSAYGQMAYLLEGSNQLTAAVLCMNMQMLHGAFSRQNLSRIIHTESLSKNESIPDTAYNIIDPDIPAYFEEIDWILKSRIALNERYECQSNLDFHVVRQTQVILEKLQYDDKDTTYWNQQFVKYYKTLWNKDLYNGYIGYIFQTVESEEVQSTIMKSKSELLAFNEWYRNESVLLVGRHPDGKGGYQQDLYYDDMGLYGIGPYNPEEELEIGTWRYFHDNTNVSGTGSHNDDGEQIGSWKWYYPDGQLREEAVYVDGTLTGPYKAYNEQGVMTESFSYNKDGSVEGLVETFYQFGGVKDSIMWSKGKRVGTAKVYHSNGQLYQTLPYKKGIPSGPFYEFYDNGDSSEIALFKDGWYEGPFRSYYRGGQLYSEGNYKGGEQIGSWVYYYRNGQIMKTGDYANNTESGEWKEYHDNGQLKSVKFLDESGKYNGNAQLFDRDGKLHEEYDYRKGVIMAYRYYDKSGELVEEFNKEKNELDFVGYLPNGVKYVEGRFVKEGRDGKWRYFDSAEVLEQESNYSDAMLNGPDIEFFSNGDTSAIVHYQDGEMDGLYVQYYLGGQIAKQGYYQNGMAQGPWIEYHKDGSLRTEKYYLNDQLQGKNYYYDVSGKLKRMRRFDEGFLLSITEYDSAGQVMGTQTLENGKGEITLHFPNGRVMSTRKYENANLVDTLYFMDGLGTVRSKGKFFNGERVGNWTWYHANGSVQAEGSYFHGDKHGEWRYYHENGKLRRNEMLQYGVAMGFDSSFFKSGANYNSFTYLNDWLYGPGTYREPGGEIYLIKDYYKGNIQGYSYTDSQGNVKEMIPIEKGTGDVHTYYPNGQEAMSAHYHNGYYHGTLKVNYPNGQIWKTGTYVHGQRQGMWREFYPDGTPKTEEQYKDHDLEGKARYYYANGKLEREDTFLHDQRHGVSLEFDESGITVSIKEYYESELYNETKPE